jgi:hypothetical protein
MLYSLNDRIVLQAYEDKGLQATRESGFALVQAKIKAVALKVLVEARLSDGTIIPKGIKAYVPEEFAKTSPIAKRVLESDKIEGKFFVMDVKDVIFFEGLE